MRKILTPDPTYNEQEWDRYHGQSALIGRLITQGEVSVTFDAPLAMAGIPVRGVQDDRQIC